MRKVKYPTDSQDRTNLEQDFLKVFEGYDLQGIWEPLRRKLLTWSYSPQRDVLYPNDINDLLIARYEILVRVYLDFQRIKRRFGNKQNFPKTVKKLKQLFQYSNEGGKSLPIFQPLLANFFMRHAEEMELHVCHYCETAYINTYKVPSVMDNFAHFLKTGAPADIEREITRDDGKPLCPDNLQLVLDLRNQYEENRIVKAFDDLTIWKHPKLSKSEKLKSAKYRNHFDLDHFLPKSECPLVGLSLYNFVPSCQVCNEKLKKDIELGGQVEAKLLKLSPTSDSYQFEEEISMLIMPAPLKRKVIPDAEKYELQFTPPSSVYQEEIKMFKLKERYNYHKYEAFRLYDLMSDYPPARIKMLRNDFAGTKTEKEIEEDLFGMNHIKTHHRCFSKMLADIYEQHKKG